MRDFLNIKPKVIFGCLVLWITFSVQAKENPLPFGHIHLYNFDDCDLCGCSTSSGSFGFGTLSNANFLGVRYIYQEYESRNGIFVNSPTIDEKFNTYQVWGQIPVYKSFYVTASVPYQDLHRYYHDGTEEHIKGLGDITVIGWYKWQFYKKKQADKVDMNMDGPEKSPHALQFGIGVKLPTGEFEEELTDRINPGFQVGTGSFDGIFSVGYNLSIKRFGANTLATYYLKGENKNDYKFGNQFSYSLSTFYAFPFETFNFMPFVGLSGDVYDSIEQYGETLPETDGSILNSSFGVEVATKRFIVGANYTLPLSQNLFGENVELKNRLSVYLNFAL